MFLRSWFRPRRPAPRKYNSLAIESLEQRQMLTASAPTVVDVAVSSTAWSSAYVNYLASHNLGTGGYSIPVGSSAQALALPWNNLNQIKVKFSENVKVEQTDLTLTGANVAQYQFSNFSYNNQTFIATWTLTASLDKDKLLLDLAGDGLDPIVDLDDGFALDGEWTNNSDTFASGNGTQGGDFEFRLDVLPGDASQNGTVTASDYSRVWSKRNTSTTTGAYEALLDINGSGAIDATDYSFVLGKIGTCTPTGNPAGQTNDAPTENLSGVSFDEDAAAQNISIWDAFQDLEDDDAELTYTILSNSNSALFSSTDIDVENGQLILQSTENAFGTADIVIRATDSNGLYVDAQLHVNVGSVNDAPVIISFSATTEILDIWILTGHVTDVDDNPEGWIVNFYGVLDGYQATVEADGSFELIVQLDPYIFGETWVQVADIHSAVSNSPIRYVGVT
ncbi:MAG: hypothetical protein K8T91_02810 [Planctomycetes bacterium]|nr:hypothetical protein [Planctomycetota bacterium]